MLISELAKQYREGEWDAWDECPGCEGHKSCLEQIYDLLWQEGDHTEIMKGLVGKQLGRGL